MVTHVRSKEKRTRRGDGDTGAERERGKGGNDSRIGGKLETEIHTKGTENGKAEREM